MARTAGLIVVCKGVARTVELASNCMIGVARSVELASVCMIGGKVQAYAAW